MNHKAEDSLLVRSRFQNQVKLDSKYWKSANIASSQDKGKLLQLSIPEGAEVLFITSYPPRECGIATYSQDLIRALNKKFNHSFSIKVCALESGHDKFDYPAEVKYTLKTAVEKEYESLAAEINHDRRIILVLVQHEFGFYKACESAFLQFLHQLEKPVVVVFHTVLPKPDAQLRHNVRRIAGACISVVVMTHNSSEILTRDYDLPDGKIQVIAHGTHLVDHLDEQFLKDKYGLTGRKVLTTFGLLSSGKSIETTLEALPSIIEQCPNVLFLIIGKTHPEVRFSEGEKYRESLERMVEEFSLQDHVIFINKYLATPVLLEYLQLTDIYLFTTNDPYQTVSGTFSYAMSCACPIISTPIPHAVEVLTEDTGIIFDFHNSRQLAQGVLRLLGDDSLRRNIGSNTLRKIVPTAWENSAIAHARLLETISGNRIVLHYELPEINLSHFQNMTTDTGILQFSKINQPDIDSGYTLDDNARALIAMCMHFKLTGDETSVSAIRKYLRFIAFCLQPSGNFLNYVNKELVFTDQNHSTNLDDANGRALWALGYLVSCSDILPGALISEAEALLQKSLRRMDQVHSTRSMAFTIKGLYYYLKKEKSSDNLALLHVLANRLAQMYYHQSENDWNWFEPYLTYANSILPEAMLCAWFHTGETTYRDIAVSSFDFLLSKTFNENGIEVISNRTWLQKGEEAGRFGEQPIDVAYTILALNTFYTMLGHDDYRLKMVTAFNWFLGNNRLQHIVYNPCTGGCYDGLEETHVNLNQGAESTISYLLARLTVEEYRNG
jgi:glycosyltransferase involved in cell wall biosynthesis